MIKDENKQTRMKQMAKNGASVGAILAMVYLIAPFEGKVNQVYLDPVGIPTVCYGQTGKDLYGRKIEMNKGYTYTDEECDYMLNVATAEHEKHTLNLINKYNHYKAHVDDRFVSQWEKSAYISFTYNLGPGNLSGSTLRRLINNGNHYEACGQLVRWVRAGGKVLRGLVSRRGEETEWCLGNVTWEVQVETNWLEELVSGYKNNQG